MIEHQKQLKSTAILFCVSLCLAIIDKIRLSTYGQMMAIAAFFTLIAHLPSILLVVYCLQRNSKNGYTLFLLSYMVYLVFRLYQIFS